MTAHAIAVAFPPPVFQCQNSGVHPLDFDLAFDFLPVEKEAIGMPEIQRWTVNEVRSFRIFGCTLPGSACMSSFSFLGPLVLSPLVICLIFCSLVGQGRENDWPQLRRQGKSKKETRKKQEKGRKKKNQSTANQQSCSDMALTDVLAL